VERNERSTAGQSAEGGRKDMTHNPRELSELSRLLSDLTGNPIEATAIPFEYEGILFELTYSGQLAAIVGKCGVCKRDIQREVSSLYDVILLRDNPLDFHDNCHPYRPQAVEDEED
jgi:hypothetical protein